jgi:hypothetical protein
MNANQMINMVIRIVMRRFLSRGLNAGMDAVGKRMGGGAKRPPRNRDHRS